MKSDILELLPRTRVYCPRCVQTEIVKLLPKDVNWVRGDNYLTIEDGGDEINVIATSVLGTKSVCVIELSDMTIISLYSLQPEPFGRIRIKGVT